jgi:hypothetical protein
MISWQLINFLKSYKKYRVLETTIYSRLIQTVQSCQRKKQRQFFRFVAKGLFLCEIARSDIQPAIALLSTRVKEPNQGDWFKLKKMLGFLKFTQEEMQHLL